MGGGAWTDHRIELLKKLWAERRSASFIAARLRMSRSAVLGKLFRLQLGAAGKRKPAAARGDSTSPGRGEGDRAGRKKKIVPAASKKSPEQRSGKTLLELDNRSCRWLGN